MKLHGKKTYGNALRRHYSEISEIMENAKQNKQLNLQVKSVKRMFFRFLQDMELSENDFAKLNKTDRTKSALIWLNYLYKEGKKLNTLRIYAYILINQLNLNIDGNEVKKFIKAIGRVKKNYVKRAKPITIDLLQKTIRNFNYEIKKARRRKDTPQVEFLTQYKALFLLMFFGAFRVSEISNLELTDVTKETNDIYRLEVHKSKTSKTEPIIKYISKLPRRQGVICPFRALSKWLELHSGKTKRLFYATRSNKISTTTIMKYIKDYFGQEYQTHSFRRGFVSEAGANGWDALEIAFVTGHKSLDTLKTYYAPSYADIKNKMKQLPKRNK